MGLFGKGFDEKAALLGFFSPQAGQMYGSRKRRDEQARKEAERQARLNALIDSAQWLSPADRAFAKENPGAFEKVWEDRMKVRQFGDKGGTLAGIDPATGMPSTAYTAPSTYEVGRDVIRFDGQGKPTKLFSGVEPVAVPEVGVFGWNNEGPVNSFGQPGQPVRVNSKAEMDALPPGTTFVAPDGSLRVKPQGGASAGPARPFPGF
jgi:hypothetical protein